MMNDTQRKTIAILGTGGTISAGAECRTHTHYHDAIYTIEDLLELLPELKAMINIEHEQICQIFSEHMTIDIWFRLAKRVQAYLDRDDIDGVVITHGTDTMEETAYFLNLIIKSHKPIVLTGAMQPANVLGYTGHRNLFHAVMVAAYEQSHGQGVLISLNDTIHCARDVTKTNVHTNNSFKASELGSLGYVHDRYVFYYRQQTKKHTLATPFSLTTINSLPDVPIIYGYADNQAYLIDAMIENGAKGIVSAGTGSGHQSINVTQALAKARQHDIIVVRCTRSENGVVMYDHVTDSIHQFVAGNNLSAQKARILLALGLTITSNPQKIQHYFNEM